MHGREAGENTHGALNVSRCPGSAGAHARSICPTASRGLGERCAALEADEGICGTPKASRGLGEPCTGREAGENTHGALNVSRCPWSAGVRPCSICPTRTSRFQQSEQTGHSPQPGVLARLVGALVETDHATSLSVRRLE